MITNPPQSSHCFEESHLFRLILTIETRVVRLGRRNHQSPSSFESEAAAGEPTLFSGVGLECRVADQEREEAASKVRVLSPVKSNT